MIKSIDVGFIVSRVMQHYGLDSFEAVLGLPIARFWMLNKNIDRQYAEHDLRLLSIAVSAQGEGAKEVMKDLRSRMGEIVVVDEVKKVMSEKLDRVGLHALKSMNLAR